MLKDIPQSFGNYFLKNEIGRGGFGKVFEALDSSGQTVAIKILSPSPFLPEAQIKQIIKNTVEISEKCSSLNVVKLKDAGCYRGFYSMVFDFYKNGSLEKVILEKKLSTSEKTNYLISIANTLHQLHSKGIIHGDIKPANILLSDEYIPLIADFYHDFRATPISGMPKGTIDYMSPEQAQGKLFSYSSDIYSLGVMTYLLFTGKSPFSEYNSIRDLLNAKIKGQFPEPATIVKIAPALNKAIIKAMSNEPENRFESPQKFAEALKSINELTDT